MKETIIDITYGSGWASLAITLVLIGAPFLATHVMASQYNGACPNNQGGSINATDGFSCVSASYSNTTVMHFDPFFNITGQKPPTGMAEDRVNNTSPTQQPTCTPPINGSCDVFNGKTTYMFNNQTVCADGSHADNNGMCHYPICPDGSSPVGKGTCVGPEMGECIHAADGNGNCQGITYCGGPATVSGGYTSCPDRAPTNTSLTLPPLRCDQPGYVSCYKFGYNAGWLDPTLNYCPMSGYGNHGNTTQDTNYCLGFTAGQIQEPIDQAKIAKAPSPACPTHTPSCCVGKNGEIIGNATDRRCA